MNTDTIADSSADDPTKSTVFAEPKWWLLRCAVSWH